ncbi:hypothetical protein HDU82_005632, partial [Entophlyctis luteolus]
DCQLRDWPTHQALCAGRPKVQPVQAAPVQDAKVAPRPRPAAKRTQPLISAATGEMDAATVRELRFYLTQIYAIVKPVVVCIFLSVLWIKLTQPGVEYFGFVASRSQSGRVSSDGTDIYAGGVSGAVGGGTGAAEGEQTTDLKTALSILGEIVGATIVIYLLFRYNCMTILYTFFGLIVLGLLGLFGYVLGTSLLSLFSAPLDYITFMFFLWNLTGVGMVSIFWKGPLMLQQWYMVLMSTLMALSLSSLPSITSWILLSLLAVWDLIAVLCPYGPLRLLIESSQKHNREIPALLYTASPATTMAAPSGETQQHLKCVAGDDASSEYTSASLKASTVPLTGAAAGGGGDSATNGIALDAGDQEGGGTCVDDGDVEDTGRQSGMKLGLGDFVFYSVLSARAALLDWVSTVAVVAAVLTGLNATIFLLVLFQKALPALPISIALGLLFYFSSFVVLVPFVNSLCNIPTAAQPVNTTGAGWIAPSGFEGSVLLVGKGGAGMVYV